MVILLDIVILVLRCKLTKGKSDSSFDRNTFFHSVGVLLLRGNNKRFLLVI